MGTDTSLLNTQQYKVCIKEKVEQCREKKKHPPLVFRVVAIEKGAFGLSSTTVANFTLCRVTSTDFPDSPLPFAPIAYCILQVL